MKVNLKKAAALSAALSASKVVLDHSFAVDIYADAPTEAVVERQRQMLGHQINMGLALSGAAFLIRLLISKANEGAINERLNRRALIEKQLAFVNGIPSRRQGTNVAALAREIEARRGGAEPKAAVYGVRSLSLELETESILNPILRNLRRAKRDLDDELQALNFKTEIELPADVVKVLTDLDLI